MPPLSWEDLLPGRATCRDPERPQQATQTTARALAFGEGSGEGECQGEGGSGLGVGIRALRVSVLPGSSVNQGLSQQPRGPLGPAPGLPSRESLSNPVRTFPPAQGNQPQIRPHVIGPSGPSPQRVGGQNPQKKERQGGVREPPCDPITGSPECPASARGSS